ncbi:MAG: HEAT repeat domain-containing protein [Gemmatimonadetes bacterium]|nr:HEAT repeat domain-containing protein [Gemmatimonadota bacterium]
MRHALFRSMCCCIALSPHAIAALAETEPLEERLASTSYWERMRAFKEAASVPPAEQPRYVPLIVEGLRDSDMEFRLAAVRALSGFGDNARPAIPAMVEALEIQHSSVPRHSGHEALQLQRPQSTA